MRANSSRPGGSSGWRVSAFGSAVTVVALACTCICSGVASSTRVSSRKRATCRSMPLFAGSSPSNPRLATALSKMMPAFRNGSRVRSAYSLGAKKRSTRSPRSRSKLNGTPSDRSALSSAMGAATKSALSRRFASRRRWGRNTARCSDRVMGCVRSSSSNLSYAARRSSTATCERTLRSASIPSEPGLSEIMLWRNSRISEGLLSGMRNGTWTIFSMYLRPSSSP